MPRQEKYATCTSSQEWLSPESLDNKVNHFIVFMILRQSMHSTGPLQRKKMHSTGWCWLMPLCRHYSVQAHYLSIVSIILQTALISTRILSSLETYINHIAKPRTQPTRFELRHDKTNRMSVCSAKTEISLGIRPVWSDSSLSAWRKLVSSATHWAHSEDSDQTGRMPRLIRVFSRRRVILLVLSCRGSYVSFIVMSNSLERLQRRDTRTWFSFL